MLPPKIQRVSLATYPAASQSPPDYNLGECLDKEEEDAENNPKMPVDGKVMMIFNFHGSYSLKDKEFYCKRTPALEKEKTLMYNF